MMLHNKVNKQINKQNKNIKRHNTTVPVLDSKQYKYTQVWESVLLHAASRGDVFREHSYEQRSEVTALGAQHHSQEIHGKAGTCFKYTVKTCQHVCVNCLMDLTHVLALKHIAVKEIISHQAMIYDRDRWWSIETSSVFLGFELVTFSCRRIRSLTFNIISHSPSVCLLKNNRYTICNRIQGHKR